MDRINWSRTRDILICVICIGLIFWASWTALGLFVETIVIVLLSMAVAFLLTPAVNLLVKYGFPRLLATAVTYIVVIAIIVGIGYELVYSLVQQLQTFVNTIGNIAANLPTTFSSSINFLEKQGIPEQNIHDALNQIQSTATSFAQSVPNSMFTIVTALTNTFLNIFLVGVISFYLTLDGKRIRDSLVGIAPKRWLPNVLLFEDALNRVVGNYIRGQLTLAAIVGVLTGLICVVTGLNNYALICGVLAFLFETIPMVGPALASITPLLLSLLLTDPFPRTFWVILLFIALQLIESNILGPRIVGHAVGLHPVASILALIIGARLFGVFGALLATPIVAAGWVVIASIYRSARGETADQMLARKRAPWQMRRPSANFIRRTRGPGAKSIHISESTTARNREQDNSDRHYAIDDKDEKREQRDKEDGVEVTDLIYSYDQKDEPRHMAGED